MMAVDEGNKEVMQILFGFSPDPTLHSLSGRNVYHYGMCKGGEVMALLETYL